MASVTDIHDQFLSVLGDCRSLFTHCLNPNGPHTNAGVESAFLEAFKAWEVFLEDLTVAYLTGELDVSGNPAPASISVSDPNICRRIINGGRPYASWANLDEVKSRFNLYFTASTLDVRLDSAATELREMVVCRNAIAHSSGSAYDRLNRLWIRKVGTSRSPLRSADVLLLGYLPNPPFTWFDRYLQVLQVLSGNMAGISNLSGT